MTEPTNDEKMMALEAEIADLQSKLRKSNAESAERRLKLGEMQSETDVWRKRHFVAESVLERHNIPFKTATANLSGLAVNDLGEIVGNFEYDPKTPKTEIPPASGGVESPITIDDIPNLSADEINNRWDEILKMNA